MSVSTYTKFLSPNVENIFRSYPESARAKMMKLRELIFSVARSQSNIGDIEEVIKWGEPSYATSASKSGSTVRIDWKDTSPDYYYLYVNCKTQLINVFKDLYGDAFDYVGTRSLRFHINEDIPLQALRHCIELALTYNLWKNKKHNGSAG